MKNNETGIKANTKVGQRIRSLRKKRKLSVRELAEISGLSAIAISKIERDQVSPTLSSLERLARAMELKLIDFFMEELEDDVIINQHSDMDEEEVEHVSIASLATGLRDQSLEPYILKMDPGQAINFEAIPNKSEVFVWCLKGSSAFTINQKLYEINPSDNLLFRSYASFSIHNPGEDDNEMLFVFEAPLGKHFANQMLR
ncbi:MAG: helix-turn-helix domain-containing protein [Anaerolineaceae bacterium]|nr:helix-turn-helix domain-containing protein [Anaerolineaceae bacterium]